MSVDEPLRLFKERKLTRNRLPRKDRTAVATIDEKASVAILAKAQSEQSQ